MCCATRVDDHDPDDSECSGRWSKQEFREAQEDKDVQQILYWREKSDIHPTILGDRCTFW